jgi:hypothetical protein
MKPLLLAAAFALVSLSARAGATGGGAHDRGDDQPRSPARAQQSRQFGASRFIQPERPFISNVAPLNFGAVGDGTTDDTAAIQRAIDGASALGVPLFFDSKHLYNITATLNITSPIDIEGAYRFGFWVTTPNNSGRACPWGLTSTSNVTVLNATAPTGTIRNLCIQMGQNDVSAAAGAGINLTPPSTSTFQTGWHLEANMILNPYDGIDINGAGYSSSCCGAGTTADGVSVVRNTIVSPAGAGIAIGKNTANSQTVGITVMDNAIGCISAASKASGIGVVLYDGAIWYDGTQNGPEGCYIGFAITPGVVGGHSQFAQVDAKGVLGDQSALHDLLIQPAGAGIIEFSEFDNIWAGGTSTSDNEVLISDANGGAISNLTFMGGTVHAGPGQTVPAFDIEAGNGSSEVFNLIFEGMSIDCWGGDNCPTTGVKINSGAAAKPAYITFTGNRVGYQNGAFSTDLLLNTNPGAAYITINDNMFSSPSGTGIALTTPSSGNGSALSIVGNNLYGAATPISYTPNKNDVITIANNVGVDSACPRVTVSSGTITLPNANNCEVIATSGTPNVTSIGPVWQNRKIMLQSDQPNGFKLSFSSTAQYPICRSVAVAENQVVSLLWRAGGTCWATSL